MRKKKHGLIFLKKYFEVKDTVIRNSSQNYAVNSLLIISLKNYNKENKKPFKVDSVKPQMSKFYPFNLPQRPF